MGKYLTKSTNRLFNKQSTIEEFISDLSHIAGIVKNIIIGLITPINKTNFLKLISDSGNNSLVKNQKTDKILLIMKLVPTETFLFRIIFFPKKIVKENIYRFDWTVKEGITELKKMDDNYLSRFDFDPFSEVTPKYPFKTLKKYVEKYSDQTIPEFPSSDEFRSFMGNV